MALWVRDYAEAAQNAVQALTEACAGAPEHSARYGALLASTDVQRHLSRHQRRLHAIIHRIIAESGPACGKESAIIEVDDTVFSTSSESIRSGVSIASGYTKRLSAFRRSLAPKVQETALIDDIPEQARRSTVSLRVVTLGLEESAPTLKPSQFIARSRKSLR
ncbi:uncharacterized protein LOC135083824 [Ostrinia nubilalis]|uniref:uncharacterized protein LOC135083824 n=1 Tax=Ostrinia nubilalis TaxID=29057 RepID=UPI003082374C